MGTERERERVGGREREDYFIVRPPAHYNRSKHSGNSKSHGSNDGLKLSFLVFKALKTKFLVCGKKKRKKESRREEERWGEGGGGGGGWGGGGERDPKDLSHCR